MALNKVKKNHNYRSKYSVDNWFDCNADGSH